MQRYISLDEISDGKLYTLNDLVKADCGDCGGCCACCQGMGSSILLDPLDIYRLTTNLGLSFEQLLAGYIELNVSDGIILPNLKMTGPSEQCSFLSGEGRCTIHDFRPGFCRLFPLGRYYEDRTFRYFLQIHECRKENRTKIKVKKWIDTPNQKTYDTFICDWHYFLKDLQAQLADSSISADSGSGSNSGSDREKSVSLTVLRTFYMLPYDGGQDFYPQFYERLNAAKSELLTEDSSNLPMEKKENE